MPRKCSACGAAGHNSRTCPHRLPESGGRSALLMRKSASLPSLQGLHASASTASLQGLADAALDDELFEDDDEEGGSGGAEADAGVPGQEGDLDAPAAAPADADAARERKKGVPWTEEEHRLFLLGLQRLGKGDWRGISRQFVLSRTPTQVASHAQKYFIRQNNLNKRKRRSSLFDIVAAPGMPLPLPRDGKALGGLAGAPWASTALAAQLVAQRAAAQACGLGADGTAVPPVAAPASLFGGLPSGMHAGALLASLGGAGAASGGPVPPFATSPSGADAMLPLLYRQWLASGAPGAPGAVAPPPFPLTGAAFHRLALVPTSTLFRPVPRRATNATWGMVKSASMPELRELRLEDSADDGGSPLAMPRQRPANGVHSNGATHEDSNGATEGGRGRDGAMSPIAEGPSDSAGGGGATPSSAELVSAS